MLRLHSWTRDVLWAITPFPPAVPAEAAGALQKNFDRHTTFSPGFNQEITGLVFVKGQARRYHGGRAVLGNDGWPA